LGEDAAMLGMAYYLNGNCPDEAVLEPKEIVYLDAH